FVIGWALVIAAVSSDAATVTKKKSVSSPAARASKTSGSKAAPAKSTASKKGRKAGARVSSSSARPRQMAPTPDRYKQIQEALSAKGYLPAEQANGQWNETSAEALKRFQADQNLDATGKINSLSLIALGLGPRHET